jgi:deoxyribodipyrimidine photolyase-related protein
MAARPATCRLRQPARHLTAGWSIANISTPAATKQRSLFAGRKQWLMEHFYRQMRMRHGVLMAAGQAARRPVEFRSRQPQALAWHCRASRPTGAASTIIQRCGQASSRPASPALATERQCFSWPLNRAEALQQLDDFIDEALPHFGDFQDALTTRLAAVSTRCFPSR